MRKGNRPSFKMKYLVSFCMLFLLLIGMNFIACAASLATVDLQFEQIFIRSNGASYPATVTVDYVLTPLNSANPMPDGTVAGEYIAQATGNEIKAINSIDFSSAGKYYYSLKAKIPASFGYTARGEEYEVCIAVSNAGTVTVFIKNKDGKKVTEMTFTYVKTSSPGGPSDPSNPPTDPTNPTNPTDPTDPTNPIDPIEPINPTDPTDPTAPSDPMDPSNPDIPSNLNNNQEDEKAPQTGDDANLLLWMLLGMISIIGFIVCSLTAARERNRW